MFKTKYRIVKDYRYFGKFRIQQKHLFTAYIWVFAGEYFTTVDEAKAAVERMQKPRFEVVSEE